MLRILNIVVIAALVLAAVWVYEIKYSSTLQAEQVARLRAQVRRERDAIAALRAEWAQLDNPDRIQRLARRHLTLQPVVATQFDPLDNLPDRPIEIIPPDSPDPIGALIERTVDPDVVGSLPQEER
jgi:cell division protein FtsL